MRVLTTLLDHEAYPAAEIAALYAERWQIEIAFLHLKKTVRGSRRPLRGQSPELARQEAWALLLIHNMTATAAARAAGKRASSRLIPFTAVLGLIRSHVSADTRCEHCGRRPAGLLASLNAAILALPRHRQDASAHPGEHRRARNGTPRTSLTPSASRSRISHGHARMARDPLHHLRFPARRDGRRAANQPPARRARPMAPAPVNPLSSERGDAQMSNTSPVFQQQASGGHDPQFRRA